MSVLLATTNPEAAAEYEPNRDRRKPYLGQPVIFHMRPGEGRAGKMTAPAIVTRVEDEDHVELMIIHAADDFITRWKIPRRSEQNNVNCWSFNAYDEEHYQPNGTAKLPVATPDGDLTWNDVKAMYQEIGTLRARVQELEEAATRPVLKSHRGKAD